jgi:hypothetical protein
MKRYISKSNVEAVCVAKYTAVNKNVLCQFYNEQLNNVPIYS